VRIVPLLALLVLGCDKAEPTDSDAPPPPTTGDGGDSGDGGDGGDGGDTDLPDAVTTVTLGVETNPALVTELHLTVTFSEPATAAVTCTLDSDWSEVHLAESDGAATEHALRMGGLLADADYTCVAAPTSVTSPSSVVQTVHTPALPAGLPTASAEASSTLEMTGAYTLFTHQQLCEESVDIRLVVVDPQGRIRWYLLLPTEGYADMGAEITPDGRVLWGGISASAPGEGAPRTITTGLEEIWRADYPGADALEFHHMAEMSDAGVVTTLIDVPAYAGAREITGFEIHEIDPATDTLAWSWSIQSAIDSGALSTDRIEDFGGNWAGRMQDGVGEVVAVSLCDSNQVIGVDPDDGAVRWVMGQSATLELVGDGAVWPACQHGPDTREDRILLYDNAWESATSRVVEYQIDAAAGTATELWSWTEDRWVEWIWGDADYLSDERVLVARGHIECFSGGDGPSQIVEIDRSGEVVHRLALGDDADAVHNADRADGCALFANADYCAGVRDRVEALAVYLDSPAG
jgi:hypothetical protein